jgi:transposase-like protein
MPWQEVSIMSSRKEFVSLARQEGVNFSALCRRFGISPKTGCKLVKRFEAGGEAGLLDRPCRPQSSPRGTPSAVEELLPVALRSPAKDSVWEVFFCRQRIASIDLHDAQCIP